MAMMVAGDFTVVVEGISAPCSGSEASSHRFGGHRFGGFMAPPLPTGITQTIPTIGITATIPAPAITATIPTLAMARSPTPGRPGIIAPTPLAIIHL